MRSVTYLRSIIMLVKRALKSSRKAFINSLLKLVYGCFRFAPGRRRRGRSFIECAAAAAALMAAFSVPVYPQYQKASNFDSRTIKKQDVSPVHLVEQIPKRYIERYNRWKAIMLSVETGRELWGKYAENPAFRLT